ncbi:MAG: prepilin-type N-terminal cleavage/methylation domain-containing protein [Lachnospiraceae bacterium]|nr:prepilin-type N-terminal cleavage/methylation domain-containing protein [Lachnospiraceae bacterium]
MNRAGHKGQNRNKGFTLVEMVVVMVIMVILLSLGVGGFLAWQDWSKMKSLNTNAEDIFIAAQTQLSDYSSSGAMEHEVMEPLAKSASALRITKDGSSGSIAVSSITDADGNAYVWNDLWSSGNTEEYQGNIYSVASAPGDYEKFLTADASLDSGTALLFKLVTSYIYDKSILNEAYIILEFSPDAAQVLAVCYTLSGMPGYGESAAVPVNNRSEAVRKDLELGCYGVKTLSMPIRGKTDNTLEIEAGAFELRNEEILDALYSPLNQEDVFGSGKDLTFILNIYNPEIEDEDLSLQKMLSLEFDLKGGAGIPMGMSSAQGSGATEVRARYYNNPVISDSEEMTFRVPVWLELSSRGDRVIRIALDAADIQAQSLTYATALGIEGGSLSEAERETAARAFMKTYSFYRFGLDCDRIFLGLVIRDNTTDPVSVTEEIFSRAKGGSEENKEGEYTSFAKVTRDGTAGTATYEMTNGRHLYNLRYTEDYADAVGSSDTPEASALLAGNRDWSRSCARTYILKKDIDWRSFVAYQYRGSTAGEDYLFNSYDPLEKPDEENRIIYSGMGLAGIETETVEFPAFRMLCGGDSFSAAKDAAENYRLSNLTINCDANELFGIYGTEARRNNINSKSGEGTAAFDAQELERAKGLHPTGLFAYNYGSISDLTLDKHKVFGAYKVGGFAGENFGSLKNLVLKNDTTAAAAPDRVETALINKLVKQRMLVPYFYGSNKYGDVYYYKIAYDYRTDDPLMTDYITGQLYGKNSSFVAGIQDVGGIFGYQKYSSGFSVTEYKALRNEAAVAGQMYVGGITGRSIVNSTGSVTDRYTLPGGISQVASTTGLTGVLFDHNENTGRVQAFPVYDIEGYKTFGHIDNGTPNVRKAYCLGGICGMACNNSSTDVFNKDNPAISMKDCRSAWTYTDAETEKLINGKAGDMGAMLSEMRGSFYGGLCGFARLVYFDCCTAAPESGNAYIFGHNYVGGFCGAAQLCGFNSADDNKSTNAINVIGKTCVGGIAAITGNPYGLPPASSAEQLSALQYRPEKDGLQRPSDGSKDNELKGLLNTGLTYATGWGSTDNSRVESFAWCGGIAGFNGEKLENCDSLLTAYAKQQMLKLMTMAAGDDKYTADCVGGLVGYNSFKINTDTGSVSKINTIVYGRNKVGGAVGTSDTRDNTARYKSLCNCVLVDGDSAVAIPEESLADFKGTYVRATADYAGGICGFVELGAVLNDSSATVNGDLVVHAANYAGGFIGFVKGLQYNVASQYAGVIRPKDGGIQRVTADGFFAGGFAGAVQQQSSQVNNPQALRTAVSGVTEVKASYFAGGFAGAAILQKSGSQSNDTLALPALMQVDNINMSVSAKAACGGYYGYYQVSDDFVPDGIKKLYNAAAGCGSPLELVNTLRGYTENVSTTAYTDNDKMPSKEINNGKPVNNLKLEGLKVVCGSVNAELAAGGLFGYVPEGLSIYISHDNSANVVCTGEASIEGKYAYAGGITGRVGSRMVLEGCENHGTVQSRSAYYGALAELNCGMIGGCRVGNANPADSHTYVGGLCGRNEGIIGKVGSRGFSSMANEGLADVSGGEYTGGFCGENAGIIKLSDSYFFVVNVAGGTYAGGVCGVNAETAVIVPDENGAVSGTGSAPVSGRYAGLVIGLNKGNITGLTLSQEINAVVNGSEASAAFAGVSHGTISDCVNEAVISSTGPVTAAFAGRAENGARFSNLVNKGNIYSGGTAAGIVGVCGSDGSVTVEYCRNYAGLIPGNGGAAYGICSGSAGTVRHCLEAGGSISVTDRVYGSANSAGKNYYIYESYEKEAEDNDPPAAGALRLSSFRHDNNRYSLYAVKDKKAYRMGIDGLDNDPADYDRDRTQRIKDTEKIYEDHLRNN